MTRRLLEICVSSVESGMLAAEHGADRLEVCSVLAVGGVTPHPLVFRALQSTGLPLAVLIRPRPGLFLYGIHEKALILAQALDFLDRGADFLVVGFLTNGGQIDLAFLDELLEKIPAKKLVFHRAFDHPADSLGALEQLACRGIARVLTTGRAPTALDGIPMLSTLVEKAGARIEILPGGGIRSNTARAVLIGSGAGQIHSSCLMATHHGTIYPMGSTERVDVNEVKSLRRILNELR